MSTNEIARLSRQQARSPLGTHCIGFLLALGHVGSALCCMEMDLGRMWGRCIQDIEPEQLRAVRMGITLIPTR